MNGKSTTKTVGLCMSQVFFSALPFFSSLWPFHWVLVGLSTQKNIESEEIEMALLWTNVWIQGVTALDMVFSLTMKK